MKSKQMLPAPKKVGCIEMKRLEQENIILLLELPNKRNVN